MRFLQGRLSYATSLLVLPAIYIYKQVGFTTRIFSLYYNLSKCKFISRPLTLF